VISPTTDAAILEETIELIRDQMGSRFKTLAIAACRVGVFFTGLKLNSGHAGVAFTPVGEIGEAVCCPRSAARMPDAGRLTDKSIEEILDYPLSANVLKSAIGVALINALSSFLFDQGIKQGYDIHYDRDGLDFLEIAPDDTVCLVGAFTPYIRKFQTTGNPFTIIEKNPDTLKTDEREYYRPPAQAPDILKDADVIIITGAAIVNHTFDGLLKQTQPDSQVAVIGPTVSMIPDIYFREDVNLMAGVHITDPDVMLRVVEEGGSGYHLYNTCTRRVTFVKRGEKENGNKAYP
jgi:uncharacterized protein (DUF4213/DUF364 family)